MNRRFLVPLVILLMSFFPLSASLAQEHPEHPKNVQKAKEFSATDLENAIKADIAEKSKDTNGVFKLYDAELKKTWISRSTGCTKTGCRSSVPTLTSPVWI